MARSRDWEAYVASSGSTKEPSFTLRDEQWLLIADLFVEPEPTPEGGRPTAPSRACFDGICWVLQTGARWKDVPKHLPSGSTCWRRHRDWTAAGIWKQAWSRLLRQLEQAGQLDTSESIADGTFAAAKKGEPALAKPNAAKEPRSCCSSPRTDCRGAQAFTAPVLMK